MKGTLVEYVINYGWALLVIVVVGLSLFSLYQADNTNNINQLPDVYQINSSFVYGTNWYYNEIHFYNRTIHCFSTYYTLDCDW